MRSPELRPRRRDAGYVTAETAVVVPSLVLLLVMALWGVMAAARQIQCVDAARAGARAAARGESPEGVRAAVRSAAPSGTQTRTRRSGELVRVRVRVPLPGPGSLTVRVGATAAALDEEKAGASGDAER